MKLAKELPSKYGPVAVELYECDLCESAVQEKFMINWCQVFPNIGIDTRTMGQAQLPDELHFCGLDHLKQYLEEHVR